jgi:phosphoribosylglycinamide formyltransferase-1
VTENRLFVDLRKNINVTKIAIFASGRGSNARNIIDFFKGHASISVKMVISNKKDAPVLDIGKHANINTMIINRADFYNSTEVLNTLRQQHIDFIVLAGFLWLIPSYLVAAYNNRIVNIHPALLPKYGGKGMYGMNVHEAVFAAKETETGITIHFVNEQYDEGDIIFQERCTLDATDTPERIAQKIHQLEQTHFPRVIAATIEKLIKS